MSDKPTNILAAAKRYEVPELAGYSSRAMLKVAEMHKLFSIDGMTPSGWIGKAARGGRPLITYRPADGVKRYRLGEIVARARSQGCKFGPPKQAKSDLAESLTAAPGGRFEKHSLEVAELSHALTARSLRSEREIVIRAMSADSLSVCGVYFLVAEGSVVYVGQSKNVYNRVGVHMADPKKTFDSWCFIRCEQRMLDVLESLYIHFLQPSQQGKIGANDQLSVPLAMDELFSRLTIRGAA